MARALCAPPGTSQWRAAPLVSRFTWYGGRRPSKLQILCGVVLSPPAGARVAGGSVRHAASTRAAANGRVVRVRWVIGSFTPAAIGAGGSVPAAGRADLGRTAVGRGCSHHLLVVVGLEV